MSCDTDSVLNLGLMGGMFDPVHNGHLHIAGQTLRQFNLDEMRLIPCGNPVHRQGVFASAPDRLAMLELAVKDVERMVVDSRECQSHAPSYAFDTLNSIGSENPDSRLFYVMGVDTFNTLPTWHRWRELFSLTHLVVAARPGWKIDLDEALRAEVDSRSVDSFDEMRKFGNGKILTCRFEMLEISSSMIRERISEKAGILDLVPAGVAEYIQIHGLYS